MSSIDILRTRKKKKNKKNKKQNTKNKKQKKTRISLHKQQPSRNVPSVVK